MGGGISLSAVSEADYNNPGVLLQTAFWGALKASFGQKPLYFHAESAEEGAGEGNLHRFSFVLFLRGIAGGLSLAYIPHGPEDTAGLTISPLEALASALRPHLPRGCVFIRFDVPQGLAGEGNLPEPLPPPFRKAPLDVQPLSTVIISLMGTEEKILAGMKPKTRYNIRLAAKKGVQVREADEASLDLWYRLYRETALRDRIAIHSIEYYRRVFTLARERPGFGVRVRLFLADIEGRTEAGIMTAQTGKTAVYLYGASSNSRREYMPSYALQWQALRAAKETGALQYDMFGIPPVRDPDHPMAGLRRFKTGFGGTILNRPGSWDYPLIPSLYTLYLGAEKARTWYYRRFKKRGITQQG